MKAFKSSEESVVLAWTTYLAKRIDVAERRQALSERLGRGLMVNRLGFGHGTRVVGFERMEGDVPGGEYADGALRMPKNDYVVRPNLRRKVGKDLQAEMDTR